MTVLYAEFLLVHEKRLDVEYRHGTVRADHDRFMIQPGKQIQSFTR